MKSEPIKIEFVADNIKFGAKRVDGTMSVILDVGEYERVKLKPILDIPDDKIIKVKLEV